MKKIYHPSPNYDARASGVPLDLIVVHYTAMLSSEEALARLCDPAAKVSAHFLISKTGDLYELVEPVHRAWHAGVSFWQGERDINSRSIGIELDNGGHTFGLEPFPASQMNTLTDLLADLTDQYAIPLHRLIGHSDVAPLRKQDPGELFPWADLSQKGFGIWPEKPYYDDASSSLQNIGDVQNALAKIGYECPQTGLWDEGTQKVCLAFQRHFTPDEVTGHFSNLTCKVLQEIVNLTVQKAIRN